MKISLKNLKNGAVTITTENADDIWYLSQVVDAGDIISGRTLRKIKLDVKDADTSKVVKKPIMLSIRTEKTEFTDNSFRMLGVITSGPDDIPLGEHHSFVAEAGTTITVTKKQWLKFQLDKLKEASEEKTAPILIIVHDREEAYFALLKKKGYELLTKLQGDVTKKDMDTQIKGNFYKGVIDSIKEYEKRHNFSKIILASPAFWKEDLLKVLDDTTIKKKILTATVSSVDENGLSEVLRRPETKEALKQDRVSRETSLVENLLTEISKDGAAAYGTKEVKSAIGSGAVSILLVTDSLIKKSREGGTYAELESQMQLVENSSGEVHLISSVHDAGKKLDGLGGIGAILRYKLNY